MQADKLLPGQNLLLQFPLTLGQPTSHVGVSYYVGSFKDGHDMLENIRTPLLNRCAGLMDRAAFYWGESKRRFRVPKRDEVWCPEPVCFQASAASTATGRSAVSIGDARRAW